MSAAESWKAWLDDFFRVFSPRGRKDAPTVASRVSQEPGGTSVAVSADTYWRYDAPPQGVKLFLLTKGRVAVTGTWVGDGRYVAWQYLFKRDKAKEEALGL